MTTDEKQIALMDDFLAFAGWEDRYGFIIEHGYRLPPMPAALRTDANLIRECEAKVWLRARLQDGLMYFEGDSDSVMVKGVLAMLIRILSGQTPEAVMAADLFFLRECGLHEHFANRSMDLRALAHKFKKLAADFQSVVFY